MREPVVGVIGLGNMGGSLAKHLLESDYSVKVFDKEKEAVQRIVDRGASACTSPKEIAAETDIVITSLPTPDVVTDVYRGDDGIIAGAQNGQVAIDLSTINPETSEAIAEAGRESGLILLDAPVSGGPDNARDGSLTVLVGGDVEAYNRQSVQSLLDTIGNKHYHLGASGSGDTMKLINNVMSMGNLLLGMEMVALGADRGIDPEQIMEVLTNSGGRSYQFNKRIPRVLNRNFEPGFTIDYAKKDLRLAMTMAESLSAPAFLGTLVTRHYVEASSEGLGDEDIGAVVKLFERTLVESDDEVDEYFEGLRSS